MKRIAINGFGRIGRLVFRIIEESDDLEVVAINDLSTPEELAYLLKYDTNHRQYKKEITYKEDSIIVDNKEIKIYIFNKFNRFLQSKLIRIKNCKILYVGINNLFLNKEKKR